MPPSSEAMAWATTAWRNHLGDEHVLLDRALVRPAQAATYKTSGRIVVVLRPKNANDVANVLRIASAHEVPVKPVSGGARWGYGSRVPSAPFAALLDLSRLNRIVELDEQLGVLTVEPGVSFAMVHERLMGTGWVLPAPGSTPYASVVGNTVDGGVCDGVVPLRRRDVLALEVVLASGEIVQTAADAVPDSGVAARGLGLDLTDLFLQSNLGIVTRMRIALCRVPPSYASVQLGVVAPERLPALVDTLRDLVATGLLSGSVTLYDAVRAVSMTQRYPYEEVGSTPLPHDWLDDAVSALGGHRWLGEAAIGAASAAHLDAAISAVNARLGPVCDGLVISPGGAVAHYTHGVGTSLMTAYWRKRAPIDAPDRHPDRDRVGLLWYGPAVPLLGSAVAQAVSALGAVIAQHGFEPNLSVRLIDARTAIVLCGVLFDRDEHDAEGLACFEALRERGTQLGLFSHRPGERGQSASLAVTSGALTLSKQLKQWLDPADIIAPGDNDLRVLWRP